MYLPAAASGRVCVGDLILIFFFLSPLLSLLFEIDRWSVPMYNVPTYLIIIIDSSYYWPPNYLSARFGALFGSRSVLGKLYCITKRYLKGRFPFSFLFSIELLRGSYFKGIIVRILFTLPIVLARVRTRITRRSEDYSYGKRVIHDRITEIPPKIESGSKMKFFTPEEWGVKGSWRSLDNF